MKANLIHCHDFAGRPRVICVADNDHDLVLRFPPGEIATITTIAAHQLDGILNHTGPSQSSTWTTT